MSEGEGKPPVVIVKPETNVTSGTDVQDKLISAARIFSDLLKPTFGPRGLDKMLYKTDGTTAVTNDGAKIVAELMVKHPAAKMMVSMGNSQEEACGDGVTTTMLLCGSLLQEASNLLRKGLHPLTLVDGYRLAFAAAVGQMNQDTHSVSDARLAAVTETALRGKGAEAALDHFSPIITDALSILASNREDAGTEHVAMFKTGTGGLRDSRLIRGVVVNRRVLMDSLPNRLSDAKVAVLGGDLKIRSMSRDAEIQITSADQLDSFVDAEQSRKQALADAVIASGAGVVLCTGEVDRDILHHLAEAKVLAVGELDESEIRNAADAVGANIVESILNIETADLGVCGSLVWERREASDQVEDIIRIDDCPNPKAVTIEIGGGGDTGTEEIIRGLHDALRATSLALAEGELLPGAGSIHARMAHANRSASEAEPGRARLAMDAYARALETIPATLVENSGGDALDRILELRAAARDDDGFVGITPEGVVGLAERVWHPRAVIEDGLESATDTAMSMLRIDQVISARGD
ncbi:MAG: TCP-1/cpn60 chaperonin family protein [Candidatus Thermoplasmatota archaeon]|nr:TCP-1/cpn60 chaperonin family protein [Candidatus Thermoplasmatota archaeon]MEE3277590.1 TCP-1/cpn60 chaperonin family protein [Candidatus Thermoplasmatota archaeon]